jgi:hypothetical protein
MFQTYLWIDGGGFDSVLFREGLGADAAGSVDERKRTIANELGAKLGRRNCLRPLKNVYHLISAKRRWRRPRNRRTLRGREDDEVTLLLAMPLRSPNAR